MARTSTACSTADCLWLVLSRRSVRTEVRDRLDFAIFDQANPQRFHTLRDKLIGRCEGLTVGVCVDDIFGADLNASSGCGRLSPVSHLHLLY